MSKKILSVFIDESGDFGLYDPRCPFYIVSFVLHDQRIDISDYIEALDLHVAYNNYAMHAIHTAPLIRRESIYANDLMENRKHLFNALFNFARRTPFKYFTAHIQKAPDDDLITLTAKLSNALKIELTKHKEVFDSYEQINVYYDNGQIELTKLLSAIFTVLFNNVTFKKAAPLDYKLSQVADLICTLNLLLLKITSGRSLTKSECDFFQSERALKKNIIKPLQRKKL